MRGSGWGYCNRIPGGNRLLVRTRRYWQVLGYRVIGQARVRENPDDRGRIFNGGVECQVIAALGTGGLVVPDFSMHNWATPLMGTRFVANRGMLVSVEGIGPLVCLGGWDHPEQVSLG